MGWVQGDTLTPALSRSAGEGVGKVLRPARSLTLMRNQVRTSHTAGARQKRPSQQALMERVCDEKSGERRGDNLKMTTQAVAFFRRIFAAQIPPSPQRDQGGAASSQQKAT